MTQPAYAAARLAATKIHEHLTRHLEGLPAARRVQLAPTPDLTVVEAMIDAAFWASLRREEGYTPLISLAFTAPDAGLRSMTFERPFPLAPQLLTHVAPAVERPGLHLGVWPHDGELKVWGATRSLPPFCLVLEVVAPGLLVVKHTRGEESGKFVNIAVIQGDQIKVIDERAAMLPDCPALLTSLLGFDSQFKSAESVSVLIQLAVSMRAHKRGGTLLVVPANSTTWKDSILQPMNYAVVPPFDGLAVLARQEPDDWEHGRWQDAVRRAIDGVAGLTAVDGATVITDQYDLHAFGIKIVRRSGSAQISQVMRTQPIEGASPMLIEPSQLGGTRHLSGAQFVHDQRDSIALVASQDGLFTVFGWSPCEGMVQAHRVDALLL